MIRTMRQLNNLNLKTNLPCANVSQIRLTTRANLPSHIVSATCELDEQIYKMKFN